MDSMHNAAQWLETALRLAETHGSYKTNEGALLHLSFVAFDTVGHIYMHMNTCVYTYIYIYKRYHIYMYIYIQLYRYIYICIYIRIYIYMYVYICLYVNIHIYRYM